MVETALLFLIIAAFIYQDRTPLAVVASGLGIASWLLLKFARKRKIDRIPQADRERAQKDGFDLTAEPFFAKVGRIIVVLSLLFGSFTSTRILAPGTLVDWPGQNVRLYQALEKAQGEENFGEVVRLIRQRLNQPISVKERQELQVREVQTLIDWGLKLSDDNRWPEAVERWNEAGQKAREYKQNAQVEVIDNLLRPTPTAYPTLMPLPTVTVIPTPVPMTLPDGATAQLIRTELSVSGTVLYVRLLGPNGKPVIGLQSKDVYAYGAHVAVRDLTLDPQPISLIIAIDGSGSMLKDDRIGKAIAGALGLIESLNDGDQVNIVVFQGNSVKSSGFLNKADGAAYVQTVRAIDQAQTPLYDGVVVSIQQGLKVELGRRVAIVILSDGEDTSSILIQNSEDVAELVSNTSFDIYPIQFGSDNAEFFTSIASAGEVQVLESPDQIIGAFEAISDLLGQQYAIEIQGNKPEEIVIGGGATAIRVTIP